MKNLSFPLVCLVLLLTTISPLVIAQEQSQIFSLPAAQIGKGYRADIAKVLVERYQLQFDGSGSQAGSLLWSFADGDLPPGLAVDPHGAIVGTPEASRENDYRFALDVREDSKSDALRLIFTIQIKTGGLRLTRIEGSSGLRLIPTAGSSADLSEFRSKTRGYIAPETARVSRPEPEQKPDDKSDPAPASEALQPASSINNRFLVGVQQLGASSAASDSSPFFDFFFRPRELNARFAMWGDVRLTSTAQQVAAFVSSATNTASVVTGTKLNDFVQSFDFKFGPEFQLNPRAKSTRFALIAGFGAISPLTTPSQSTQIFKVPDPKSSQAQTFAEEFPEADGHKYIAFVPPERDRFYRQYFGGIRLRTYHLNAKGEPEKFPSMLDLTFGQNSAVTGGQLRHFVFGVDGSYQLPFKGIYIFGSSNLKVGGSKMSKTPYVLDPVDASANIKLSNPDVVITSRQLNRDVYRLGVGVDLVEIFKKAGAKN